jgi:predicted dehydrogenase
VDAEIGVAVVGVGHWGGHYVRVLEGLPGARTRVVCDASAERRDAIAQRFPSLTVTGDLAEALAVEGVHAAIICTPATTHAEVASQCLAGGKHVLVEKPLTTRSQDATGLITRAAEADLALMVGHTFLFNPSVLKVRELLMRPGLGKIHYAYARRTNLGPIRSDVNALWDLASHDVSIFNFVLDAEPEWVSAVGARVLHSVHHDVGFVTLGYPNGIVGHIHVSWVDPNKVREFVVVAANQRIVFNDMAPQESVRVFERGVSLNETAPTDPHSFGEFQLTMRDGDIISPRIEPSEPLRNQTEHFIGCIRHGRRPATDGAAGREGVRVMEAIDRSMRANGAPTPVGGDPARAGRAGRPRFAHPIG